MQYMSPFETLVRTALRWFGFIMQHCCTSAAINNMKGLMKRVLFGCATGALLCTALAHEAHVHGVGKLDVAIDGSQVILHLDTPLANLLGFAHAATSTKDREATRPME